MRKNGWRLVSWLIFILAGQLLSGCVSPLPAMVEVSAVPTMDIPSPVLLATPDAAFENAQATKVYAQSQLLDLSRRSTGVALDISQAANSAAAATLDSNRRRKLDLDYQSTLVSLNMAAAAATQKVILQQTKLASDATATVLSADAAATRSAAEMNDRRTAQAQDVLDVQSAQTAQAALVQTAVPLTATASAHLLNVTETAAAQLVLNAQAAQTRQAVAALTVYPLTATPFAVTQAALLTQRYAQEQNSFVERVVRPLIPILVVLDLLLFIFGIGLAYRRLLRRPRRLGLANGEVVLPPVILIAGELPDPDRRHLPALLPIHPAQPASQSTIRVEIIAATVAPVAQWIAELEQQYPEEGAQAL